MRVEVDRTCCIASGMCERVCPEVFGVDAEGVLQYVDSALDVSLLPLLEQAEEGCPTGAITLHRDPG